MIAKYTSIILSLLQIPTINSVQKQNKINKQAENNVPEVTVEQSNRMKSSLGQRERRLP